MSAKSNFFGGVPDPHFYAQLAQNFAVLLVTAVTYLALQHDRGGVWSLLVGAAASAANFWLLSISIPKLVRTDLATAAPSRTRQIVRRAIFEFVVRYGVLGGAAFLAVRHHAVHLLALVMGFSLPIFAIMIQGIRLTVTGPRVKSVG